MDKPSDVMSDLEERFLSALNGLVLPRVTAESMVCIELSLSCLSAFPQVVVTDLRVLDAAPLTVEFQPGRQILLI